jgi:hypothetical protein
MIGADAKENARVATDDAKLLTDKEVLEQGSSAFFVAVGEAAKNFVPVVAASHGWQALLAVAMPLMGFAVARGAHRLFAQRTAQLAQGYARAFDFQQEEVEAHAEQHKDDDVYHDTMFRTFRAMMDAAEPEVVETLGYMAGCYTRGERRPDAFSPRCSPIASFVAWDESYAILRTARLTSCAG